VAAILNVHSNEASAAQLCKEKTIMASTMETGAAASGSGQAGSAGRESVIVAVHWDDETQLGAAQPSAVELGALLIGLETAYDALAEAFQYPPHFLRVTTVSNPEFKIGLEGGKEVIDALKQLLYAVPSLIANLFRPKSAWNEAILQEQARAKELEASAAVADSKRLEAQAAAAEALARKARADVEAAEYRRRQALAEIVPIASNQVAHAVLAFTTRAMARVAPDHRVAFLGETARYAVVEHSFQPTSRIRLVIVDPVPTRYEFGGVATSAGTAGTAIRPRGAASSGDA
jgi:hypothetical protein